MEQFKTDTNHEIFNKETLEKQIRQLYFLEDEDAGRDEVISAVASVIGKVPTLERQYSDSLDFRDISVWTLKEMLRVSYELGKLANEANSGDF